MQDEDRGAIRKSVGKTAMHGRPAEDEARARVGNIRRLKWKEHEARNQWKKEAEEV